MSQGRVIPALLCVVATGCALLSLAQTDRLATVGWTLASRTELWIGAAGGALVLVACGCLAIRPLGVARATKVKRARLALWICMVAMWPLIRACESLGVVEWSVKHATDLAGMIKLFGCVQMVFALSVGLFMMYTLWIRDDLSRLQIALVGQPHSRWHSLLFGSVIVSVGACAAVIALSGVAHFVNADAMLDGSQSEFLEYVGWSRRPLIITAFASMAASVLVSAMQYRRTKAVICMSCGYHIAVANKRCPECGTAQSEPEMT